MKKTEKEIIEKLRANKKIFKKYGVKRIALFGSLVKGGFRKNSDVDLVVEFDYSFFGRNLHGLFDTYTELTLFLKKLLGRNIDILTPISIETIRVKKVADEIKRSLVYV